MADRSTDSSSNAGQAENLPGSPYVAKPADAAAGLPTVEAQVSSLPPARDLDKLRLAASDMLEFGLSLEDAATLHDVDIDTLHVYHRTYLNFVGKDNVDLPQRGAIERREIDRTMHRQFDRNWAEMLYQANAQRPDLSPIRKWLINFPLTGWMFAGDTVDKLAVSGAACVLAFGTLAVVSTSAHLGGEAAEMPEVSTPVLSQLEEGLGDLDRDQQNDVVSQIMADIERFIEFETWQERLPYVRDPGRVKPLMESYYKTHRDGPLTPVVLDPQFSVIRRKGIQFGFLQGVLNLPNAPPKKLIFFIEITDGDPAFLVDWEVLVNYEPRPWEEFKLSRSREPAAFRVRVAKGDYYNSPFMDEKKYVGFKFAVLGREDEPNLFAFATRGSEIAKLIESYLSAKLTGNHAMVLNLRYPQGAKFENILEIESIVSEHW